MPRRQRAIRLMRRNRFIRKPHAEAEQNAFVARVLSEHTKKTARAVRIKTTTSVDRRRNERGVARGAISECSAIERFPLRGAVGVRRQRSEEEDNHQVTADRPLDLGDVVAEIVKRLRG